MPKASPASGPPRARSSPAPTSPSPTSKAPSPPASAARVRRASTPGRSSTTWSIPRTRSSTTIPRCCRASRSSASTPSRRRTTTRSTASPRGPRRRWPVSTPPASPMPGPSRRGAPRHFTAEIPTILGRLVLVACSFSTNGVPDPGDQVLLCYRDRAELLRLIRDSAVRPGVAGVLVLPHWGVEYTHRPLAIDRALAAEMAGAGALAVIGTHPHVVQPWDILLRSRRRGPGRLFHRQLRLRPAGPRARDRDAGPARAVPRRTGRRSGPRALGPRHRGERRLGRACG